jgi:O-antigen ligase
MKQSLTTRLPKILAIVFTFILVILPFHEFLTTWVGSNFGHLSLFRVWKEILIYLAIIPVSYLVYKNKRLLNWLRKEPIFILITAYSVLVLGMGIWAYASGRANSFSALDGILIDTRFLVFFILILVVSCYSDFIRKHWQEIIVWPAMLVVFFGILQLFLPINFLSHFGYGANTIPAYSTVDQSLQYRRIQSTLRGANPLGAYLVLVIPVLFIAIRKRLYPRLLAIFLSVIVLYFTYSRSAYVGLALSLAVLLYLSISTKNYKKIYWSLLVGAVVISAALIVGFRNNQRVQNVFFHTDSTSKAATSSNAQRASALETGLRQVEKQPFGGGTGTAGPASEHNKYPARIAENYYVQIAQEVGWIGLVIFLAINVLVGLKLWSNRNDGLSRVLLATLIGLTFVNFVSHAWADDTLSLIWWGIAGVALAPAILKEHKSNRNESNKKTTSSKTTSR